MFGVPIDGPVNMYCDNSGVVANASRPESTLKKKHNAIAYHRVCEAVAAGTVRIAKEDGKTNIADLLTKPLCGPRNLYISYINIGSLFTSQGLIEHGRYGVDSEASSDTGLVP